MQLIFATRGGWRSVQPIPPIWYQSVATLLTNPLSMALKRPGTIRDGQKRDYPNMHVDIIIVVEQHLRLVDSFYSGELSPFDSEMKFQLTQSLIVITKELTA